MKKKVIVGMSGGVDSSVTAYILQKEGFEVIGVTMQTLDYEFFSAHEDAKKVSDFLNIPYFITDFRAEFKTNVIDYFSSEYLAGKTPNPCIACNRHVKFASLLNFSLKEKADFIATGHYARTLVYPETARYTVKTAESSHKDQTYALYNLTQEQLSKTLMPLGDYTKDEIRKIASDINLPVANKADSQEICFILDDNYARFLKEYTNKNFEEGFFKDTDGNILGKHKGIIYYTVGQRKGLGIAFGVPMYVKKISVDDNSIVLATDEEIFENSLIADNINFMALKEKDFPINCKAKIRYNHKAENCQAYIENSKLFVNFESPQRAITPGQAVVLYDESGFVLAGGTIISS